MVLLPDSPAPTRHTKTVRFSRGWNWWVLFLFVFLTGASHRQWLFVVGVEHFAASEDGAIRRSGFREKGKWSLTDRWHKGDGKWSGWADIWRLIGCRVGCNGGRQVICAAWPADPLATAEQRWPPQHSIFYLDSPLLRGSVRRRRCCVSLFSSHSTRDAPKKLGLSVIVIDGLDDSSLSFVACGPAWWHGGVGPSNPSSFVGTAQSTSTAAIAVADADADGNDAQSSSSSGGPTTRKGNGCWCDARNRPAAVCLGLLLKAQHRGLVGRPACRRLGPEPTGPGNFFSSLSLSLFVHSSPQMFPLVALVFMFGFSFCLTTYSVTLLGRRLFHIKRWFNSRRFVALSFLEKPRVAVLRDDENWIAVWYRRH